MVIFGDDRLPASFWRQTRETSAGCWEWIGYRDQSGYGRIMWRNRPKGTSRLAHRLCWQMLVGPVRAGVPLDHLCRNRACVNPVHLHEVSTKENGENRGVRVDSVSGIRGVLWSSKERCWRVEVGHNGRKYRGGRFADRDKAECAAIELRNHLYTNNVLDRAASRDLSESELASA